MLGAVLLTDTGSTAFLHADSDEAWHCRRQIRHASGAAASADALISDTGGRAPARFRAACRARPFSPVQTL